MLDALGAAFLAVGTQVAEFGEGRIQRVLAEIMVIERPAEGDDGVLHSDQRHRLLVAAFHFGGIAPDNRADTRQDRQAVGVAAKAAGAALQVGAVGLGLIDVLHMHENRIGVFSGKVTPILRGAGLEDRRLALA